jgi:hypothetical protein
MDVYKWRPATEDKPPKDEPLKENDHAADAMRYGVLAVDRRGGPVSVRVSKRDLW